MSASMVDKVTRVIVTGSRSWRCAALAGRVVSRLRDRHGDGLIVVHGAAPGVDSAFADAAARLRVATESHPADWERLGKGAGPRRNQEMVDAGAAMCLAFHPTLLESKGTLDCCRRAAKAGIPVWLTVDDDPGVPVPIMAEFFTGMPMSVERSAPK